MSEVEEVSVSFDLDVKVAPILAHTLGLMENHFEVRFKQKSNGDLKISQDVSADIHISDKFVHAMRNQQFSHVELMGDKPLILCENNRPDYLSTCAYMANFLQEYVNDPTCFDELDRYRYHQSYQYKFRCIQENLVLQYLIKLQQTCSKLSHLRRKLVPSRLWVSHDIDYLYHTIWPDLKTAVKKFRIDQILRLLSIKIHRDPDTEIFDQILKIHDTYGIKATFFWLVNDRKYKTASGRVIENANFNISDKKVRKYLGKIKAQNHHLGVHRSLGCQNLIDERNSIDPEIKINRNHFLAGRLPDTWRSLESAGITADATGGFSEAMGFRNSYGTPLHPFDPVTNRAFKIREYPLHIMDATFINLDQKPKAVENEIKNFLMRNQTDCLISLLWHNNYFSEVKFREWIDVYKSVLSYCKNQNFIPPD